MNNGNTDNKLILLIEDEDIVATMTTAMLDALGYGVYRCATAAEAYQALKDTPHKFFCVILDMILPDATGESIYPELKALEPELKCILASGYSRDGSIQNLIDQGVNGFIQKPFKLAQLKDALDSI